MTHKVITFITIALLLTGVSYSTAEETKKKAAPVTHSGVVIEMITAGVYTYLKIDENGNKFWVAAPKAVATVGARVVFTEQLWMSNFESKALKRTFDKILFVNGVRPDSPTSALSGLSLLKPKVKKEPKKKSANLPPNPDGIYTIEEIFSRKDDLKNIVVKVRGNVVKVSPNIMGKTWVHIEDGTGSEGNNKIIFTSDSTAAVGETLTAQGTLVVDKDFGAGYFYPVIVEDATFTKKENK